MRQEQKIQSGGCLAGQSMQMQAATPASINRAEHTSRTPGACIQDGDDTAASGRRAPKSNPVFSTSGRSGEAQIYVGLGLAPLDATADQRNFHLRCVRYSARGYTVRRKGIEHGGERTKKMKKTKTTNNLADGR